VVESPGRAVRLNSTPTTRYGSDTSGYSDINHLLKLSHIDWILLITLAYLIWAIAVCIGLILARRSPVATVGWMISLLFLPYIGALVYMFFGPRRLRRKRLRYSQARKMIGQAAARMEKAGIPDNINEDIRLRYRQLAGLATRLGQAPPLRASAVTIYTSGDECYSAIEKAIAAAAHHIHVEYYIWDPGGTADLIRDALTERARAGIAVKVIVDDVGSGKANEQYFAPLIAAGGEVAWFNPIRISRFKPTLLNFRTHRKIVVIDGRIAFTGGMNISNNHSIGFSRAKAWRDTHMRIDGAPAGALQRIFLEDWQFANGQCKVLPEYFAGMSEPENGSSSQTENGPSVQIIASGPDDPSYAIQTFLFAAIATARHSLSITTPYFVPNEPLLEALKSAALRGLEVRLLVPKVGDSKIVSAAARSYFDELAAAGVLIFEYGPPMLHAKTMVIDNTVAIVGTANLDNRSFRLNFEVMAVVYDLLVAEQLGGIFEADLGKSKRYRARTNRESFKARFLFGLARLFSPIL
jgi:cardiolipin synthase A/B